MSREKQEAELVREAIRVGGLYMQKRGAGEFEATDSASEKTRALYRLLVKDQLIQPLARDQENERNMKHKLALWIERQLPAGHPLKS
ncbi:DUF5062 family protein [Marinobacterium sedimentorum]|jgi:hypothetical protein|uniref:DUF5062 family protein n=1 Tax=Marinobacterium sedimentorum TaxID=2927804 RepID=UPI0020C73CB0|nr:DUF5062 family protein [Marinobacterium sedimentorum]MCP8689078.1 DUF5062 family protein [Marinobacterium sedimentorum]